MGSYGPTKFADGSTTGHRLEVAAVRAIDAYMMVEKSAERLSEELDQITSPGVVRVHITDEDSLVIAIKVITHDRDT